MLSERDERELPLIFIALLPPQIKCKEYADMALKVEIQSTTPIILLDSIALYIMVLWPHYIALCFQSIYLSILCIYSR